MFNSSKREHRFAKKINYLKFLHEKLLTRLFLESDDDKSNTIYFTAKHRLEKFIEEIELLNRYNIEKESRINFNVELSKFICCLNQSEYFLTSLIIEKREETIESRHTYDSVIAISPLTYLLGLKDGDCFKLISHQAECVVHLSLFSSPPYNGEIMQVNELISLFPYGPWVIK